MEIKTVTIREKGYPKALKKIPRAPKKLFFKGKLLPKERCFAIVGTRRCSPYGKQMALEIGGELARAGVTVVSGLARGIDTSAHRAAVEKNKRTIAILGTGLDKSSFYPRSNLGLADKIINTGGCLISEYPPGTHGTKFTFPERNRLISGLSLGVLVVEAKRRSGALITARWAEKQGKKLFAVPGPIHSLNSKGCHYLIKRGKAHLVEGGKDILKELNLKIPKQKEGQGDTDEESLILRALKEKPLHVDKIIEETKLSPSSVASILPVLEIKKKIRNLGNNVFSLIR